MVETYTIKVSTGGDGDILDLTPQVAENVRISGFTSGVVTVFVPGSTAGITTVEFEPGLRKDLPEFFDKIIPKNKTYHHDATWGDGNGFSHLRAALVGPSLTVPFVSGRLNLGTWQQIVLLDFDNRPRRREILVQVIGE
jgi:secondary thiamine-phosphate synthase enzyme